MDPQVALVLSAFLGSGALAAVAAKFFRPAPTLVETVSSMQQRLDDVEADASALRNDLRLTTDYVHLLRAEITHAGGTPPPWPMGLKL